ncbi:MAG: hemin-degrading factor, partial [Aquincola sp.]|nr:hemin-degrading factor [Aquincola sp.]
MSSVRSSPSRSAAARGPASAAALLDTSADLRHRFAAARQAGQRHRDAAASLGLSEGEAVALHSAAAGVPEHTTGLRSVRLRGPWLDLLRALEPCGALMALTRNDVAVHEKTGSYTGLAAQGPVALALGDDIDLRLFFQHWTAGYAVHEPARAGGGAPTLSLQFFDAQGSAVHKIYPRPATDLACWQQVAQDYADPV